MSMLGLMFLFLLLRLVHMLRLFHLVPFLHMSLFRHIHAPNPRAQSTRPIHAQTTLLAASCQAAEVSQRGGLLPAVSRLVMFVANETYKSMATTITTPTATCDAYQSTRPVNHHNPHATLRQTSFRIISI
jgi:hypothetical protein